MGTYSGWRKEKERLQSMIYEESSVRILSLERKRGRRWRKKTRRVLKKKPNTRRTKNDE